MSKRFTQADNILYAVNNLRAYWNGGRGLEVDQTNNETKTANIRYNGNNVGYIIDNWDESEFTFMVLTLQTHMLPDRVANQLAQTANENQLKVIFVPVIDIGFGKPEPFFLSTKQHLRIINKIAKYSQDDIQTAVMMGRGDHVTRPMLRAATAYTYNQTLQGYSTKFHAEATLAEFAAVDGTDPQDRECWFMDLEPCENCLQDMINQGARSIAYITPHKDKWNTLEYLQLVNDIDNKFVRTPDNLPVIYSKEIIK